MADTPIERPLDLNPERAGRSLRAPYGIIDIGSNSVRLIVYDQIGRAPLPRFNEKVALPAWRRPRRDRPHPGQTRFAAPSMRCGAFAPSPRRWASSSST